MVCVPLPAPMFVSDSTEQFIKLKTLTCLFKSVEISWISIRDLTLLPKVGSAQQTPSCPQSPGPSGDDLAGLLALKAEQPGARAGRGQVWLQHGVAGAGRLEGSGSQPPGQRGWSMPSAQHQVLHSLFAQMLRVLRVPSTAACQAWGPSLPSGSLCSKGTQLANSGPVK